MAFSAYPKPTVAIAGHSIHAMLAKYPLVCFALALVTDLIYLRTADIMWQNFSAWLLLAGLVVGALAAIAGIVDLLVSPIMRQMRTAWGYAGCFVLMLLLALLNSVVHAGDGWTGVVPWGIALSVITFLVGIACAWLSRTLVLRNHVGVLFHV